LQCSKDYNSKKIKSDQVIKNIATTCIVAVHKISIVLAWWENTEGHQ